MRKTRIVGALRMKYYGLNHVLQMSWVEALTPNVFVFEGQVLKGVVKV
jgi:hypothetical protein